METIEDEEQISSLSIENPFIEKKIFLLKNFPKIIQSLTSLNIFFDVSEANNKARTTLEQYLNEIENFVPRSNEIRN